MLCIIWYHMLVSWLHEPEKNKRNTTTRTRTCSYSSESITVLRYMYVQNGKTQIQPSGTTFSNFSDDAAVLRAHENCCRFATL